MKKIINEIVSEILEVSLNDNTMLSRETNSEWDSISHLEIIMAIEEEFGIRFTTAEVAEIKNTEDIYSIVKGKQPL